MATEFLPVPDWFPDSVQGAGVATSDVSGSGRPDLVVLVVDAPEGPNRGVYRVGRDLTADGQVAGWTPWRDVPDWFCWANQGADLAVADVTGSGRPDLVVFTVDNPAGVNRGIYRIGRDLDADGVVTAGWSPWRDVPDWFCWENQGAGLAVADVSGNGRPDLVVFTVDNPAGVNRGIYRIGRDLDADGVVTGGWTPWRDVPDWFSWENSGGGVALADQGGGHDLVAFAVDNPVGANQTFYRTLPGLQADGSPNGTWGPLMGVPGWFSWENADAGVTVARIDGRRQLVTVMVDVPVGSTQGYYRLLDLDEAPAVHGAWEVVPAHSGVLAIHAALLPTGKVLFFAGSGNNQERRKSPDFGDVAKGVPTSAVWDPATGAVTHPPSIAGADHAPFDFFCGGDTFLADGLLLSAGGNLAYVAKGRADAVVFDPQTEQWQHRAAMERGRWYPTLLSLGDGRVLAVSGLDESGTALNPLFEIYDPAADHWQKLPTPDQPLFFGLPLYAHLFLLGDGRVLFDGGRTDDARPQGPVLIDLATNPLTITGVPGLELPETRNQAASVLLPPAQEQRVMIVGGGPEDETNGTGSTAVVDLRAGNPTFAPAPPMSLPRMHLNAVLLPDRTVFVSGGALAREERVRARLQSEIFDPVNETWRAAATATVVRMYHSVALLLPDGRVVAAGGNPPPYGHQVPWEPADPNEEMQLEIYSPPYLFRGPRPEITAAPDAVGYGTDIEVTTPDAGSVRSVSLIRPGVTTHAFDNSQRLVDLPIAGRSADVLTLTTPASATIAPPGWYMLFLLDDDGVPSIASWLRLA